MTPEAFRGRLKAEYLEVMRTSEGRRFLKRLMINSGLNRSSFSQDPMVTAFNEGQRAIALLLQETIRGIGEEWLLSVMGEPLGKIERKEEEE